MRKSVIAGVLLFLGFAIAFAPAGLMRLIFDRIPGAALTQTSGTLWHGQGRIIIRDGAQGRVTWRIRPAALFDGAVRYDLQLTGPDQQLAVIAKLGLNRSFAVRASGTVGANLVNQLLAPYDMMISGDVKLLDAGLVVRDGMPERASGSVSWDGGPVRYVLSGKLRSSTLPPMIGQLGSGPEATVFEENGQTPLIKAKLLDNGFAKIGITKRFTTLVANPWPGSDPDDAVVLEVEEQIF